MRSILVLFLGILALAGCGERIEPPAPATITLFNDVTVHFTPDASDRYDTPFATARDNGRVMGTFREFPAQRGAPRITAVLRVRPIRQDMRSVVDRWDRAGHVALIRPGMAPLEMMNSPTPNNDHDFMKVVLVDFPAPIHIGHAEHRDRDVTLLKIFFG